MTTDLLALLTALLTIGGLATWAVPYLIWKPYRPDAE
jgi:hypothetical protein